MQWMTATTAIMHALKEKNETMTYGELAKVIGMIPDGWKGHYSQNQIGALLRSMSAVELEFNVTTPLPYDRIVTAATGKPGVGLYTRNKIVGIKAA
jgi:hypothetical protein